MTQSSSHHHTVRAMALLITTTLASHAGWKGPSGGSAGGHSFAYRPTMPGPAALAPLGARLLGPRVGARLGARG